MTRIIVCGGRDFTNEAFIYGKLDAFHARHGVVALMHGGASGVDRIASEWGKSKGIPRFRCEALWETHGRSAGPRRNARMLEWGPDFVIAFPGNRGTNDMVSKALAAGVPLVDYRNNA